jgi:DNA replication licensing factor MCM5
MFGFDANRVYSVSVHDVPAATSPDSPSETEKLLFEFIQQFRVGGEFVYRYDMPYRFHSIITHFLQ